MTKGLHFASLILGTTLMLGIATLTASADTLQKVKQRGTLIVGVKADFKPWGFLDPSGKPVGMEIDLAEDVAKRLGVKLETVVVQTSNRVQFLDQGKIDIMIATLGDLPARRRSVGMVTPHYNMSGTNVLSPKKSAFKQWSELKNKTVCGTQGSYYNKMQSEAHGLDVVAFKTVEEALAALRAGNCVAFLQNDALISIILTDQASWGDYEVRC